METSQFSKYNAQSRTKTISASTMLYLMYILMLISYQKSSRGKDVVIDKNKFKYTNNGNKNGSVNYWRCSNRDCSARILTRKSTGELVSELPTHEHSNKLMKQAAKEIETELIKSYAKVDGSTSKQVLLEISNNVMGSNSPGLLSILYYILIFLVFEL